MNFIHQQVTLYAMASQINDQSHILIFQLSTYISDSYSTLSRIFIILSMALEIIMCKMVSLIFTNIKMFDKFLSIQLPLLYLHIVYNNNKEDLFHIFNYHF